MYSRELIPGLHFITSSNSYILYDDMINYSRRIEVNDIMDFSHFIRSWINDKCLAELVIDHPEKYPNIINGLYRVYRTYTI